MDYSADNFLISGSFIDGKSRCGCDKSQKPKCCPSDITVNMKREQILGNGFENG